MGDFVWNLGRQEGKQAGGRVGAWGERSQWSVMFRERRTCPRRLAIRLPLPLAPGKREREIDGLAASEISSVPEALHPPPSPFSSAADEGRRCPKGG